VYGDMVIEPTSVQAMVTLGWRCDLAGGAMPIALPCTIVVITTTRRRGGTEPMTTFKKWNRAKHVEQAGGEEALAETRRMVDDFIDAWQLAQRRKSASLTHHYIRLSCWFLATRPPHRK
jgi:hypothetical protein